jgi:hypothetical protein
MAGILEDRPWPVKEDFFALPPSDMMRTPVLVNVRIVPVKSYAVVEWIWNHRLRPTISTLAS